MNFKDLMERRISRKDFIKGFGFFVLLVIFFPGKALSQLSDDFISGKTKDSGSGFDNGREWVVDGVKVMEVRDD